MDSTAQRKPQPVLIQTNHIVKYGETMVTLPDKTCKRKCNELVLEPRLRIRSVQKYQYDNLHMKLDSDDSITVGSPLRSPQLGYGSDDASSFVPQQGSHVCILTESLSGCTVASSSQICVAGKVSIAPSPQLVHSSDNWLLHQQVMRRKRQFSGTVQTASNVGTQMESNSSTSSMVTTLGELNGTSKQDYNFLSLSDSALMVRVPQPYYKAVRQPLFNILGSVCNSSIDEQEGSMSGSLMLIMLNILSGECTMNCKWIPRILSWKESKRICHHTSFIRWIAENTMLYSSV